MTLPERVCARMKERFPKATPESLAALAQIIEEESDKLKPVESEEITSQSLSGKPKRHMKRNVLLDALVEACGGDPLKTTQTAFRSAGTALADIKSVEPDLAPEELFRRARRYRNKFPGITLTPNALCKFWGELSEGPAKHTTAEITRLQNTPPEGWLDWLCANMPSEDDPAFGQLQAAKNMRSFGYMPESWRVRCRKTCGEAQSIAEVMP